MSNDLKRRRILAVVSLLIAGGVLAFFAFGGIGENLVYYWSPSELEEAGDKAVGATIRLGGLVADGTIVHEDDGHTLRFDVTDGKATVPVVATSVPPAMFREGIGVLVEGTMTTAGEFETDRLLVKHDNQYRAPTEDEDYDMDQMIKSMKLEAQKGDA